MTDNVKDIIAKGISIIFHPVMLQMGILVIWFQNENYLFYLNCFFWIILIPSALYFTQLYFIKQINIFILKQKQRLILLGIIILYNILLYKNIKFIFSGESILFGFTLILLYTIIIQMVAFVATIFFKPSLHIQAVFSIIAMLIVFTNSYFPLILTFPTLIPIGWARWHLKAHTLIEILAGIVLGVLPFFILRYLMNR